MGSLGEPGIQSAQYERNGGVVMKKLMLGFLALALALWLMADGWWLGLKHLRNKVRPRYRSDTHHAG
jgi:uncharacterized membrane protein YccF (DUF307 family)